VGELRRHHPHLHATSWLFEVHDFIQKDGLISFDDPEQLFVNLDNLYSFVFHFFVGMCEFDEFKPFDAAFSFQFLSEIFVVYSDDLLGRKKVEHLFSAHYSAPFYYSA